MVNVLGTLGFVVSLIGVALALLPLLAGDVAARHFGVLALFIAFVVVFAYLPTQFDRIQAWTFRIGERRCHRHARRFTHAATQLAPFEANFDLNGDLLTYSRGKQGVWQLAWHRKLGKFATRGLAIQAANVTAIFRRANSIVPAIVILQQNPVWIAQALREFGIAIRTSA